MFSQEENFKRKANLSLVMLAVHVICLKWGMEIGDQHLSVLTTQRKKNIFFLGWDLVTIDRLTRKKHTNVLNVSFTRGGAFIRKWIPEEQVKLEVFGLTAQHVGT